MENRKLAELAEFLDIEAEEIEVAENGRDFYTADGVYTVMTEDEAYDTLKSQVEAFYDSEELATYADDNRVEAYMLEYYTDYAKNIKEEQDEKYANRLIAECVEAEIINENELTEYMDYDGYKYLVGELAEYKTNSEADYYGKLTNWLEANFGKYEAIQIIESNDMIDYDRAVQVIIDNDNYDFLANYDSKTNTTDDFLVFRQSDTDERSPEFLAELESEDLEY